MKIIPVTQLKQKLSEVISHAQELGEEYVVTNNGRPVATIMGFKDWEGWRETLEILSDPKQMRRIRKNLAYFNRGGRGKTILTEEIFPSS